MQEMGQWRLFFLKSCLNLKLLFLLVPGTRGGVTGAFASHHSVNSFVHSFTHSFPPYREPSDQGDSPEGEGSRAQASHPLVWAGCWDPAPASWAAGVGSWRLLADEGGLGVGVGP